MFHCLHIWLDALRLSLFLSKKIPSERPVEVLYTSLFRNRRTNLCYPRTRIVGRCSHLCNCNVESCISNRNREAASAQAETAKMEAESAPMLYPGFALSWQSVVHAEVRLSGSVGQAQLRRPPPYWIASVSTSASTHKRECCLPILLSWKWIASREFIRSIFMSVDRIKTFLRETCAQIKSQRANTTCQTLSSE